jgi:hypothetical protein
MCFSAEKAFYLLSQMEDRIGLLSAGSCHERACTGAMDRDGCSGKDIRGRRTGLQCRWLCAIPKQPVFKRCLKQSVS